MLKKDLELFIPMLIKDFNKKMAIEIMDKMNECLKYTPWMYLLTGDGIMVESREKMVVFAKAMFRVDSFGGNQ